MRLLGTAVPVVGRSTAVDDDAARAAPHACCAGGWTSRPGSGHPSCGRAGLRVERLPGS